MIRYSNLITGCLFLKISKFWLQSRGPYHFLPLGRRKGKVLQRMSSQSKEKEIEFYFRK